MMGECGHQYTAKLEGMLNDIKTSEDLTKNFLVAHPPTELGVELRLNILTSGYWPASSAPPSSCEIPPSLKPCLDTFRDFYIQKHQGRRLTWNFSQGTAEVRARLSGNKRHELVVSTYQMVLLTCFNGNENALSYADLLSRTKIPIEDFKRHLQSLYANPKCRLLIKTTAGNPNDPADSGSSGSKREPAEGDTFSVNSEFESKLVRVKVPLIRDADPTRIAQDPGVQEGTDMPASVEEDRKHLTEAVIVRIMKSRLVVEHNQLVVEVTKHLQNRFTPTPALIKQRIERLIEREYLERSEKDRKVYNYLA
ncbi:unnamed protein product [Amoebophrya sp. A25]|nr:unnamed protein product [Amoebophrya sp. A25]|eukprot:GSA25T00017067001.1